MEQELIDTSILIDSFKAIPEAISCLSTPRNKAISVITHMEIIVGARNKNEKTLINQLLQDLNLTIIPVNPKISSLALELVDQHTLSNHLSTPDSLIAATALENNLKLITLNTKHFKQITNLKPHRPY